MVDKMEDGRDDFSFTSPSGEALKVSCAIPVNGVEIDAERREILMGSALPDPRESLSLPQIGLLRSITEGTAGCSGIGGRSSSSDWRGEAGADVA